ncbi:hypothetical protein, partial [Dyella monticola]|uniref:hypothetical protein n=1 Tax=Dyella monticola TaxID=1927958 RepID=UPI001E623C50
LPDNGFAQSRLNHAGNPLIQPGFAVQTTGASSSQWRSTNFKANFADLLWRTPNSNPLNNYRRFQLRTLRNARSPMIPGSRVPSWRIAVSLTTFRNVLQLMSANLRLTKIMIRKLAIASVLLAGVTLSASVVAQQSQRAPASAAAPAPAANAAAKAAAKAKAKAASKQAKQAAKAKEHSTKEAKKAAKQAASANKQKAKADKAKTSATRKKSQVRPPKESPAAKQAAKVNRQNERAAKKQASANRKKKHKHSTVAGAAAPTGTSASAPASNGSASGEPKGH